MSLPRCSSRTVLALTAFCLSLFTWCVTSPVTQAAASLGNADSPTKSKTPGLGPGQLFSQALPVILELNSISESADLDDNYLRTNTLFSPDTAIGHCRWSFVTGAIVLNYSFFPFCGFFFFFSIFESILSHGSLKLFFFLARDDNIGEGSLTEDAKGEASRSCLVPSIRWVLTQLRFSNKRVTL